MIESLGRRLRVVFGRSAPADPVEERPRDVARAMQQVEFVAYGEDCLLSGVVRMQADRLTDMLNDHDEYLLVDVLVEGLADEHAVELTEVLVHRDELLLVHAAGPRGNQDRRHRTRSHPVAIQVGPYHVRGYLHALPGADPVQAIRRRKPMVPLTDAWIEFPSPAGRQRRRVGTVVVNREQIDWIVPAVDDEVEMPDLPLSFDRGPLLKDFTGALFEGL
ncbi:MAG: hypothetical protein Q7S35_06055 [Candidatus Limnocylindrales bacterium]|nr:hypothetical protein [Candidatus Limnocylindrales bacterium]